VTIAETKVKARVILVDRVMMKFLKTFEEDSENRRDVLVSRNEKSSLYTFLVAQERKDVESKVGEDTEIDSCFPCCRQFKAVRLF
jgi:hypothetical protein